MSVEAVLDKIKAHNGDVLGCVAASGGRIYSNLPELYDMVDAEAVSEYATIMFEASDALDTDQEPFGQLFLEFANHSVYSRRLDDGVLVLLNDPVERTDFKKTQIGVNLFVKPLKIALERAQAQPETAAAAAPMATDTPAPAAELGNPITPTRRRRWF